MRISPSYEMLNKILPLYDHFYNSCGLEKQIFQLTYKFSEKMLKTALLNSLVTEFPDIQV